MLVWQAHKARIRHMAFAPDGAELATTAGTSKPVSLWRAATGESRGKLHGHIRHARGVAYSPDGRFLASTQNHSLTTVCDRPHGHVVAVLETPGWCIESVSFRADSSAVAVATEGGAREWPTADFSPSVGASGVPLASTARYGTSIGVGRVLFSPCGRYLAAFSYYGLELYDVATRAKIGTLKDPTGGASAAQLAFAPDGNTLAVVFGLRIHLLALPHGEEVAVMRGHPNYIHALGFLPDGKAVVSAGADGVVRIWDAATGAAVRQHDWGIGKVCAAAVSPDGTVCAAGGENGKIVVWDVDG
jgi:WD40 repeat protein